MFKRQGSRWACANPSVLPGGWPALGISTLCAGSVALRAHAEGLQVICGTLVLCWKEQSALGGQTYWLGVRYPPVVYQFTLTFVFANINNTGSECRGRSWITVNTIGWIFRNGLLGSKAMSRRLLSSGSMLLSSYLKEVDTCPKSARASVAPAFGLSPK